MFTHRLIYEACSQPTQGWTSQNRFVWASVMYRHRPLRLIKGSILERRATSICLIVWFETLAEFPPTGVLYVPFRYRIKDFELWLASTFEWIVAVNQCCYSWLNSLIGNSFRSMWFPKHMRTSCTVSPLCSALFFRGRRRSVTTPVHLSCTWEANLKANDCVSPCWAVKYRLR